MVIPWWKVWNMWKVAKSKEWKLHILFKKQNFSNVRTIIGDNHAYFNGSINNNASY